MIKKTQNNLQKALNLTTEKSEELIHKLDILTDNEYYKDEVVHKNYHEEHYNILIPNRKQASQQKYYLRRKSQRKENHNKKDGFTKHNIIKNEENHYYICPENKILPVQQIYPGKYNDRTIYYTNKCRKCPSKNICLTNKITGKIITDYTSKAKELLEYNFETPNGQKQYKKRMPMVEPRFAYNKQTLKYRQYHLIGLYNAKIQQTLMATAQNIVKIHNIELKEQVNEKILIDLN